MSDLFESDEEMIEMEEVFEEASVSAEIEEGPVNSLDARRRLESMLEEMRLEKELNDFIDFD